MKVTIGLFGHPGASPANKTSGWRRQRPIFKGKSCTGCRLCTLTCPDAVVYALEKKRYTCDLDYCKGCGICAHECPAGDIVMVVEGEAP